jgi:hypothetical protein
MPANTCPLQARHRTQRRGAVPGDYDRTGAVTSSTGHGVSDCAVESGKPYPRIAGRQSSGNNLFRPQQ